MTHNEAQFERRFKRERERVLILERMVEEKTRELFVEHEKLKELNRYLNGVLETTMSALLKVDQEYTICELNGAFLKLVGYERDEDVVGKFLPQIIPVSDLLKLPNLYEKGREDSVRFETLVKTANGKQVPTLVSASRMMRGEKCELVLFLHDISEMKSLESQVHQAQKLESIGQLAAGIAHEINTPIQYIRDNTSFFKREFLKLSALLGECVSIIVRKNDGEITSQDREGLRAMFEECEVEYLIEEIPLALDQTLEGAESVARIVQAMKHFSHPGSGEKLLSDLNVGIENTVMVSRNEWKYVADVEMDLETNLRPVCCFPAEINQVLLNLLVNAAHAIAEANNNGRDSKGKILISSKAGEQGVVISVRDTGRGISKKNQPRIFEPFFTTKTVGKGTGQGLSLSYSIIVKRHGGKMWFTTKEGEGTTFYVSLPYGMDSCTTT